MSEGVADHGDLTGKEFTRDHDAPAMSAIWERRLHAFRAGHSERQAQIGAHAWSYLIGGQGQRAALLLHGSASDAESLFGLMAPLERRYRVIAPTYPAGARSVASVADSLAILLASLGLAPAMVIGYSLGGYVAQTLAWRHPEVVANLALLHTGAPAVGPARLAALQNAVLAALPVPLTGPAARLGAGTELWLEAPGLAQSAGSFWRRYLSEMAARVGRKRMLDHGRLVVDFLSGAAGPDTQVAMDSLPPIMIINAGRDRTIEPEERRALDALYPHATRVMLAGAGHLSVPTQPERYVTLIESQFPLTGDSR